MAIQAARLALACGFAAIVSPNCLFAQTTPTAGGSKSTLVTMTVPETLPAHERKPESGEGSSSSSASPGRDSHSNSNADRNSSADLEEIVVTAEKRTERLQDVPVPVTVISGQTLVDTNQLRVQDYYASIPGLSFSSGVHGEPFLAIRGITADYYSNPSVGITIDDVPYGSSTSLGGGYIAPDIDPSDLARVEVLRGPQGTLYGANSLGGLIKFVTVDPSTDGSTGSVQAGTNSVYNGAELGYSARGAVNLRLSDATAIRASAYTHLDPGYIDNIQSGERGVNERHADGGRLSLLWRPSDAFSLKLNALLQHSQQDGLSGVYVGPSLGDLQQDVLRGTGRYDSKVQSYSAALTANLGGVNLTALTSYNVQSTFGWDDVTPLYGSYAEHEFGVAGATSGDSRRAAKFTQEVRVSVPIGERVEWLLGGFYTHEDSPADQVYFVADPATGAVGPSFVEAPFATTYAEQAVFTDLTLHVTDRFDVQLGGRESQIKQAVMESLSGVLIGATTVSEGHSKADAFTYLVTPRFNASPDLMVYARLASGYRPGGPNINTALLRVPSQYNPDTTRNYEIGVKGAVLDHVLSFDASLYYIDWKDIQLNLLQNGLAYDGNGSAAKSEGVELSVESRPLTGLAISTWFTWDDAVLTQAFPSTSTVYGVPGDRLPSSSRFSGYLSLQQHFRVTGQITGFAGAAVSYVGDRVGAFRATSLRQSFPAYTQANLRAGMMYASWTANLFVTNLADSRGVLAGGLDAVPTNSFIYTQPRTVGLAISRTF
jgi:iron complex outermembrane receptor protein